MKKQTIEETAEEIRKQLMHGETGIIPNFNDGFIEGVKYQSERMFSKEYKWKLTEMLYKLYEREISLVDALKWLEQYKK